MDLSGDTECRCPLRARWSRQHCELLCYLLFIHLPGALLDICGRRSNVLFIYAEKHLPPMHTRHVQQCAEGRVEKRA